MNYNWNIKQWITMYLAGQSRKPKRIGILTALLANIKQSTGSATTLYVEFVEFMQYCRLRTRYNVQQGSLEALLNKLFDATNNRIYLVTAADTFVTNYGQVVGDDIPVIYGKLGGEARPTIYGYISADYANNYDGYIYVPSELAAREAEIKKWVDSNIFLGKTYKINYF